MELNHQTKREVGDSVRDSMRNLLSLSIALIASTTALGASGKRTVPQGPPQPTEVKVISMPPAQPGEVRVTELPPASAVDVHVISTPKDDAASNLVLATWGLLIANVVLCGVTVWVGLKQGQDTKRRDRVVMRRDISRIAQENSDAAKRHFRVAEEMAGHYLRLWQMAGKEMPQDYRETIDHALEKRRRDIGQITDRSAEILSVDLLNFDKLSDEVVIRLLLAVDAHAVQLRDIRNEMNDEEIRLARKEADFRQQRADAMEILQSMR